jgi:hypothetical protein
MTVLLVATCWWPFVGRFAQLLVANRCQVAVLGPKGHACFAVPGLTMFKQRPFQPMRSLSNAIAACAPTILVPTDDRAVGILHTLHKNGTDAERKLVEASLGGEHGYATTISRVALLQVARQLGIAVPDNQAIAKAEDLTKWMERVAGPWVIKMDGVWGGRGVRIAASATQAAEALQGLQHRAGRALKRLVINRDPFWLADWLFGRQSGISVQRFVRGRPGTLVMLCRDGEVLATTIAEVVAWEGGTGSSTILRLIDRPDMAADAARLARHLTLTGFYGLDYMLEAGTDRALLIELNPRITSLANIRLEPGRDLVAAFASQFLGVECPPPQTLPQTALIAHFPPPWPGQLVHPQLAECFQDIPVEAPALIAEMLMIPWADRPWLARFEVSAKAFFQRHVKTAKAPDTVKHAELA